jgi:hypothetical protein
LAVTPPLGCVTNTHMGLLVVTPPLIMDYGPLGCVTQIWEPIGCDTTFDYDPVGCVTPPWPMGCDNSFDYDPVGCVTRTLVYGL